MAAVSSGHGTPTMYFEEVAREKVTRDMFTSDDVYLFDVGYEVIIWIGKGASRVERKVALQYAQSYLKRYKKPVYTPIMRCFEQGENELMLANLD